MRRLEWAIDRPLPVFLAAALMVLLGLWSLRQLPVNRTPEIEIPYALVFATYEGAVSDTIETEVTIELEEQLNAVEGLRHLRSVSREGLSTHILEFEDHADVDASLRDAREKVELARTELPAETEQPIVKELSFDDEPIIFFTLTGGQDRHRLRRIAERMEPQLQAIEGVADVEVFGGVEREVRVHADPRELARHGLTLEDIVRELRRQSRTLPAGELRSSAEQRVIRSTGEFSRLDEIRDVAVGAGPAGPIALRDVARVEPGSVREVSDSWWNGEPSVTLIVRRRADVNTLETVRQLRAQVDRLRAGLPDDVEISASADQSEDIDLMLGQLGGSAAFGLALVVAVLLAVFGFRQALLVSSVLPFSLLFTVIGLHALGMGISNIALFAMILVLGLVVDGAIVIGEAIQTEREGGVPPRQAAKAAVAQVGMPVIAADLTTIAAFLPMLMMVGVMGQFMSVLPIVVVFALTGSVFVDHLFLPAAASRLRGQTTRALRHFAPDGLPWFSAKLPRLRRAYDRALDRALHHRAAVVGSSLGALLVAGGVFASGAIDSVFLPTTDLGRFTLNYELPLGTSLHETGRVGQLLAAEVARLPEVESYVLTTGDTGALNTTGGGGRLGPSYGSILVELVPEGERERSEQEVVQALRARTRHYAGVGFEFHLPEEGPPTGADLTVRLKGEDLSTLAAAADRVERALDSLPEAVDVRADYDRASPEIRVELDRQLAASRFGVLAHDVSSALRTAFYGAEVGRMWLGDERVDIRVKAGPAFPHTVENVRELPLRTAEGAIVPLGEMADAKLAFGANAIFRHDAMRAITVRADAAPGSSSVALESAARASIGSLGLAAPVRVEFGGETEERDRSYASLQTALKWGVLLIFVIIAVQFNSLLQPLIVLLSVPLAAVGVVVGLLVTGTPFSFMVFIGMVSLTGIVVNSGIVLIDAINRKRRAGMPVEGAIREACGQRLRPVLLTAVTTIAGLLPLTLGVTRGGAFWVPLGIAIISGLVASTGLTLFVAPVLYSLLVRGNSPRHPERVAAARRPIGSPESEAAGAG